MKIMSNLNMNLSCWASQVTYLGIQSSLIVLLLVYRKGSIKKLERVASILAIRRPLAKHSNHYIIIYIYNILYII